MRCDAPHGARVAGHRRDIFGVEAVVIHVEEGPNGTHLPVANRDAGTCAGREREDMPACMAAPAP